MASTKRPDDLNPKKLQTEQAVYTTENFPSGGGASDVGPPDPDAVQPDGGSTGSNARDSGQADASGTPGGGMAGSAGG